MSDKKRNSSSKNNAYILKKIENDNQLKEEIRMSFDDPTKYLSINPNLVIGKIAYLYYKCLQSVIKLPYKITS